MSVEASNAEVFQNFSTEVLPGEYTVYAVRIKAKGSIVPITASTAQRFLKGADGKALELVSRTVTISEWKTRD
jgi:hypothetical protein